MNSVKLYGRLVKDPEIRSSGEGKSVASFTVACQRKYKDKDGNYSADFVNCVAFGKTAEIMEKHFSKGMPIIVDGRINTGSYTNKDGNKVYTTNVAVDSVEFVGSKSPLAEVELISLITTLIRKIGLKDAKLHINSIGCANCRKVYNDALLTFLKKRKVSKKQ